MSIKSYPGTNEELGARGPSHAANSWAQLSVRAASALHAASFFRGRRLFPRHGLGAGGGGGGARHVCREQRFRSAPPWDGAASTPAGCGGEVALSRGFCRSAPALWAQQEIGATGQRPAPSPGTQAGTQARRTSWAVGAAVSDREPCGVEAPPPLKALLARVQVQSCPGPFCLN